MLKASDWFNRLGSNDGGMHVIINGKDHDGKLHTRKWFIIAKDGHGPHIPTIPAILLAEQIAGGNSVKPGAYPCVGLVALESYLRELNKLSISTVVSA